MTAGAGFASLVAEPANLREAWERVLPSVSLALDLMEEFRPLITDAVVIELFRRSSLDSSHARIETGRPGVLLTEAGRRLLTAGIEDRLLTVAHHVPSGQRVSYRRAVHLQAAQIARCILSGEIGYRPVTWR